jgi:hypothetical protein
MTNGEIQNIVMGFDARKDYLNLLVDIIVIHAGINLKTTALNYVLHVVY